MKQPRGRKVQALKLGAIAQMLPLLSSYGVNLLATPYILAQLGLHDFGIWSITAGLAQYLGLADLGIARAANRYVALFHARGDDEQVRSVVAICAIALGGLTAILSVIPWCFSGLLDKILHTGDHALVKSLLVASIATLVCSLFMRTFSSISIGKGRQIPANVGVAIFAVAQIVGGILALSCSPTLINFAWGTTVGAGIGLLAVFAIILFDEGPIRIGRPTMPLAREVLAYGFKGQILGAADILWYQSGKIIAGFIIGPAAAGAFELGIRLVKGAQAFGAAASVALATHLTRRYAVSGRDAIIDEYAGLTRRNAAVAIFPPLLLGSTSVSLVPLWLNAQQEAVTFIVVTFTLGVAANVSTGVCTASFMAVGRAGIVGVAAFISALTGVVAALAMGSAAGLHAIILTLGGWLLLSTLLQMLYLHKQIGIPVATFFGAIAGPSLVGLAASVPASMIGLLMNPQDRTAAVTPFLMSAVTFSVVFAGLGWALGYLPRLNRWSS